MKETEGRVVFIGDEKMSFGHISLFLKFHPLMRSLK